MSTKQIPISSAIERENNSLSIGVVSCNHSIAVVANREGLIAISPASAFKEMLMRYLLGEEVGILHPREF